MKTTHLIYLHDKPVGEAHIPQGLYYCISCCCNLDDKKLYDLIICGPDIKQNLGILVPEKGKFTLSKMIPAKRIDNKEISFKVVARHELDKYNYIPVSGNTTFDYIDALENAVLLNREGKLYLRI